MKILIVEDDPVSNALLSAILAPFGSCDVVMDGISGLTGFVSALLQKRPYDLICLDIMLPGLDGQGALKQIRQWEQKNNIGGLDGAKIIMITALSDSANILQAFRSQCEGYIVKPIRKSNVLGQLKSLGLIPGSAVETK
ncbi:MAG: response regulator [Chitinivibrionales bacterium]|nr:response regulator [Chitinivibrionales bacterium]